MAERTINWNTYINHVTYGAPPPEWQRYTDAMKNTWNHPLATKLRDGVVNAASAWWQNVNPARWGEKDRYWVAGLGVGALESAAVVFLMPIGGGLIKGGVNFAATQAAFVVAREIDARYNTNVGDKTKSFIKGMAAGAAYFSPLSGIANELITNGETLREALGQVNVIRDTVGAGFDIAGTAMNDAAATGMHEFLEGPLAAREIVGAGFDRLGTAIHDATGSGLDNTPVVTPDSFVPPAEVDVRDIIDSKIEQIQNDAGFKTSLAANVGEKLPMEDEIIADTLAKQGKTITDLSPQALDTARKAVQHAMENQVNISGHGILNQMLTDNPNLDVHSEAVITAAKNATKEAYDQWLVSADQHTLADIAQKTIQEQIDAQKLVASFSAKAAATFVAENQGNSELVMEHIVKSGENAGQMLHDLGGFSIGWDMSDVAAFSSLKALNPFAFSNLASSVNLDEGQLEELIKKANMGDREAYRKLIESLHSIRTGTTIKMLTKKGLSALLASVK